MSSLWTALYEDETKESLATMVCELREKIAAMPSRDAVLAELADCVHEWWDNGIPAQEFAARIRALSQAAPAPVEQDGLGSPSGLGGPASTPSDAQDAARWRALLSSQRIRVMGSAGFKSVDGEWLLPSDGYLHMGVEFWSLHNAPHPSEEFPQDRCRNQLIAYADYLRALKAEGVASVSPSAASTTDTDVERMRDALVEIAADMVGMPHASASARRKSIAAAALASTPEVKS